MDDVGIKIHKLKHLRLHGKMLLAEGVHALVGSINFAAGSLDSRRELSRTRDCSRTLKAASRAVRTCSPLGTTDANWYR